MQPKKQALLSVTAMKTSKTKIVRGVSVLLTSCHLNGHSLGFRPQCQKLSRATSHSIIIIKYVSLPNGFQLNNRDKMSPSPSAMTLLR